MFGQEYITGSSWICNLYLVPLGPEYLHQHHICEHPQPIFLLLWHHNLNPWIWFYHPPPYLHLLQCKLIIIYILLFLTNYPHSIPYIDIISSFKFSLPMFVTSISQNFIRYIFNCYTYLTLSCWNSMPISDLRKTRIQMWLHKSRYTYMTFSILSIKLHAIYIYI